MPPCMAQDICHQQWWSGWQQLNGGDGDTCYGTQSRLSVRTRWYPGTWQEGEFTRRVWGRLRKLQTCWSNLSAWKTVGKIPLGLLEGIWGTIQPSGQQHELLRERLGSLICFTSIRAPAQQRPGTRSLGHGHCWLKTRHRKLIPETRRFWLAKAISSQNN